MVQLLLGNIGVSGGGMNALRGHSNIQGSLISSVVESAAGLHCFADAGRTGLWEVHRGAGAEAAAAESAELLAERGQVPREPHEDLVGRRSDGGKTTGPTITCPRWTSCNDMLQMYELMHQGKVNGYLAQGFNPLAAAPNKAKMTASLSKLKFLVIMDPLATETSEFWRNYGEHNDVDSSKIQTEVFRLPTTCFAEEDGALVNSARWLQWHWKGASPPGEARSDIEIMSGIFTRMRSMYAKEGGAFPDPILNLTWKYAAAGKPPAGRTGPGVFRQRAQGSGGPEGSHQDRAQGGRAAGGIRGAARRRQHPERLLDFLRVWGPTGNLMARRDNADPSGIGQTLNWAWAWPANRRILYNRASCDPSGKPYNPARKLIAGNGTAWSGVDVPDFKADENPAAWVPSS